jgi:hypothetical protein
MSTNRTTAMLDSGNSEIFEGILMPCSLIQDDSFIDEATLNENSSHQY